MPRVTGIRRVLHALALLCACALAGASPARAITANPLPVELTQPDGTRVKLLVIGDEWGHWWQDLDGYTVVLASSGYVYARAGDSGALAPTSLRVGAGDPRALGLARNLRPAAAWTRAQLARVRPANTRTGGSIVANGVIKNLVILARFSDHFASSKTRPVAAFDSLFNQLASTGFNAPTGSVRDAWREFSQGRVDLQSTVLAWVTLPQPEVYYANGDSGLGNACPNCSDQLVIDALNAARPLVDFGQFDTNHDGYVDAIDIIHSGYGAEVDGNPNRIWSHKSNLASDWDSGQPNSLGTHVKVSDYHVEPALWSNSGVNLVHIGVIAHETGHFFGLPDLYDRDNSSIGIGSYCLMSNAWGFDNDQLLPPHLSAWCKVQLGWVTPVEPIGASGFTLRQAETTPDVVRIRQNYGNPGEYLLIENREPVGLDRHMPHGGLAVWHIDDSVTGHLPNTLEGYPGQPGWPQNGNHYTVALLQADGRYDLEKNVNPMPGVSGGDSTDLYHDVKGIALSETTNPSTDGYAAGIALPTGNTISAVSAAAPSMTFQFTPATWVQFGWTGFQTGRFDEPYATLFSGAASAATGGIVLCKAGTTSEKPSIPYPVTIKPYQGLVWVGH